MLIEGILLLTVAAAAVATYYVVKIFLYGVDLVVRWSPPKWDDILFNHKLLRAISQLAPAITVNFLLPSLAEVDSLSHHWLNALTSLYILVTVIYILVLVINNIHTLFEQSDSLNKYAIRGIFSMAQLIVVAIGVIVAISIMFGKEPATILTAIGASAAVFMLVFKDTILGLVASVQFSVNKMLRKGDWIICDSHNINGEVLEVNLTTIKIKNWDNSVSTIPPYTLVSDSFRNYQHMRNDHARRIDRSVLLDASTIRFMSRDELAALAERGLLDGITIDEASRLTNSKLLRLYLEHMLANDDRVVHKNNLLTMVRQLEMTATGLPLQLYFFTHDTAWEAYERVQSDIMDEVYAVVNAFGLRIFQSPTGRINP